MVRRAFLCRRSEARSAPGLPGSARGGGGADMGGPPRPPPSAPSVLLRYNVTVRARLQKLTRTPVAFTQTHRPRVPWGPPSLPPSRLRACAHTVRLQILFLTCRDIVPLYLGSQGPGPSHIGHLSIRHRHLTPQPLCLHCCVVARARPPCPPRAGIAWVPVWGYSRSRSQVQWAECVFLLAGHRGRALLGHRVRV